MGQADVNEKRRQLREIFRVCVQEYGKLEVLAYALGKKEPYKGKLSDAMNGVGDAKVQWEWFAPIFLEPRTFELFLRLICEAEGYAIPEKIQAPTPDDLVGPLIDSLDRLGEHGKAEIVKLAAARRTTVEALRRACGR